MEFEISEGRDMQEPLTGFIAQEREAGINEDPERYAEKRDRALHIPEQEDG